MKEYYIKDKIANIAKHFMFRNPTDRMERDRAIARASNEIYRELEAAHERYCMHMADVVFSVLRKEFK